MNWLYAIDFIWTCVELQWHIYRMYFLSKIWPHIEEFAYKLDFVNTLRPRQNGRHFADDMFKCIFLKENVWIPIEISLKFIPKGSINNNPALFQIMAWRRPGDKPLSEPMMVSLPTHICVTQPQWVKTLPIWLLYTGALHPLWFNVVMLWWVCWELPYREDRGRMSWSGKWGRNRLSRNKKIYTSNLFTYIVLWQRWQKFSNLWSILSQMICTRQLNTLKQIYMHQ